MTRLRLVVEGQTEETFTKEILAPHLLEAGVHVTPLLLGGNVSWQRLKRVLEISLKQDQGTWCSTFIDYYGIKDPSSFPGRAGAEGLSTAVRKQRVQEGMHQALAATLPERFDPRRFLPYVQMYEFEALLFSDPDRFAAGVGCPALAPSLHTIRAAFATPEDINDSPLTAPSKRIVALHPGYNKPLHGTLAALEIGLPSLRALCPLFDAWVTSLETLAP